MSETKLCELLEEEGNKAEFVFDYMTDRFFYIELKKVDSAQNAMSPKCTLIKGNPPKQEVDFEDYITKSTSSLDLDNAFYGDSQYNEDEIDEEGFDIKDPNDPSFDEKSAF
ncbi:MAG TPA: hypothetical protein DDY68_00290 [Porphyromonadaceae bacterium]|nr:hypothetical protein [Porphyromonadaceae bacterium]